MECPELEAFLAARGDRALRIRPEGKATPLPGLSPALEEGLRRAARSALAGGEPRFVPLDAAAMEREGGTHGLVAPLPGGEALCLLLRPPDPSASPLFTDVSHELRAPLQGILGLAGLLLDSPLTAEQREQAAAIHRCGESLLTVVGDVLDFSQLQAGRVRIAPASFDLVQLLEEVLELAAPRAAEKGVELALSVAPAGPRRVFADPVRLRQIVTNLAGNALKFTDHGHVLVAVDRTEADGRELVRITVEDTGIGVSPDSVDRLFTRYARAEASAGRSEGCGLGLAISRELAERMGGDLRLTGGGAGTRATLRLPLLVVSSHGDAEAGLPELGGARALLACESAALARSLGEALSGGGLRVTAAATGRAALAALRDAAREGDPFDLLLADFRLPEGEGMELLWAVARDESVRGLRTVLLTPPGVAVTAAARRRGAVTALLAKPVRLTTLRETVRGILRGVPPPEARSEGEEALFHSDARVLLADDDPVNRMVAARRLERLGCRVDLAENGAEALSLARAADYELILLDLEMPVMDGLEACRAIREAEAGGRRAPVLALTAYPTEACLAGCREAGMDGALQKPLRAEDLRDAVERWARGSARAPAPAAPAVDPGVLASLEALGGEDDPGFVTDLFDTLLASAEEGLVRMADALRAGDGERLRAEAHRIKGAASNVGAVPLADACRRMEEAAANGVFTAAREEWVAMSRELARVRETARGMGAAAADGATSR